MRRRIIRRWLLLGAMWAVAAVAPLRAQVASIPQALRDSVANPPVVDGGEVMHFETMRIDAGRIGEKDVPPRFTFRWRNRGDRPLVITRAETTCGCAKPTFDRQPVLPDGESEVTVTYYPRRHPGSFHRRIYLFTQLSDRYPTAILHLTGEVIPATLPTDDYPHAMNSLLLKRMQWRVGGSELQTERILCLNAGDEPLRITADTLLLPPYLRFRCEPEEVEPAGECDLVIRFDPSAAPERLPREIPVILQGLGLPPSGSTLRVVIGE